MQEYPKHYCGVFGVYGSEDAAALTALGLHALQHRGQEAAGIVSFDGRHFYPHDPRANFAAATFPSAPLSPNPPGTRMPFISSR